MGYLTLKGARASTFVVPPLAPSTVKKVRLAREPVYESHMPEEANAYTQSRARSNKEELCLKRRSGANGGGGRPSGRAESRARNDGCLRLVEAGSSHVQLDVRQASEVWSRMFDTDVVDGNSRDVKMPDVKPLACLGEGGGPVEGSSV